MTSGPIQHRAPLPDPRGTWRDEIHDAALVEGIVRRFVTLAMADPTLRPLYQSANLDLFVERVTSFLVQYWGGPRTYSAERGLPRLPQRHESLHIGPAERDAWLAAMYQAIAESPLAPEGKDAFYAYLEHTADSLVNQLR